MLILDMDGPLHRLVAAPDVHAQEGLWKLGREVLHTRLQLPVWNEKPLAPAAGVGECGAGGGPLQLRTLSRPEAHRFKPALVAALARRTVSVADNLPSRRGR